MKAQTDILTDKVACCRLQSSCAEQAFEQLTYSAMHAKLRSPTRAEMTAGTQIRQDSMNILATKDN